MARGDVLTAALQLVVEECCSCGTAFAMPRALRQQALDDHDVWFYCPRGHQQHYTGKNTHQQLDDAKARETALRDQLAAAVREGEETRRRLVADRARFAAGICPCCRRTFAAVRRHMQTMHPDFDASVVTEPAPKDYRCSCGFASESYLGLRIHQGRSRKDGWDQPSTSRYRAHLTRA